MTFVSDCQRRKGLGCGERRARGGQNHRQRQARV